MPRRTTTPADEGIRAAAEEHSAAIVQTESQEETATTAAPPMKIDVRITGTRNAYDNPTRATASVVLNDCFVIKGFRVVKGENGLFCSPPARRLRDGEYSEVCHAITPDFARQLNASVLNEYQVHLAQQMEESMNTPHVYEQEQAPATELDEPQFEPEMEM